MTKIRLRIWLLLCSLLPALLISVFSGGYFSYVRHHELQFSLSEQARHIAVPLAITSASLLASEQQLPLQQLIDTSHRYNSPLLTSIAIFNQQNQLVYNSNPQFTATALASKQQTDLTEHGFYSETATNLIFYHPLTLAQNGQQLHLGYLVLDLHKDTLHLRQQSSALEMILILISCLLLSCAPAFYILQRLYRPVRLMNIQLKQLINHDHTNNIPLVTRKPKATAKELIEMQQGLNKLSAQIVSQEHEMQQQIDQANSDLQQTLEQLEVHNVQLDFARRKALEENRQKSEFLAKMSHELRTPLNGVIGFTRQVLKTKLTSNQHDYLTTIQKSANSLLHLVNDVLDFSKLEEGRLSINPEPFSLRDMLNDATELLAANAFDKYLELVLMIDPECPDDIIADPKRFSQVLMNIAGNAIKFTDHGSIVIRVSCNSLNDDQIILHCSVQDTGRGISSEQQQQLFHGFGSSDPSSHQSGSGLGLMISQRLVEAMGGKIGFESTQAEGSTFWFTLKCKRHQLTVAENLPIAVLEQKTVLYFEPQQHSREAMLQLLQSWYLNVTICSTLSQLQHTLAQQQHYDIAIIGKTVAINQVNHIISVMQKIKPQTDYLYLLVNTLSPSIRETLLNSGADACLSKPAHLTKLAMALAHPYLQHQASSDEILLPKKAQLKVLTVDDNEANLKLINTLLAEQVEHIESAFDGAEAWHKATQHVYDIIFLDINMPIMDGINACQRIRQSSLNEHTPIIAVTAHTADGERERLMMLGFDEFLSKPLDEKMLQCILQEFCQHKQITATAAINPTPAWPESKIVDWALALQQANGKVNLMQDMLAMLISSIEPTQLAIQQAIKQHDRAALLQHIHKLHGGCCYTGVPRLKQLAEIIETSLKQQVPLQTLEPEFFELDDLLQTLLQEQQQWPEWPDVEG
ncbi:two-component sensor histidine kinase BarA [Rheinheimera salexigens]|uniref:histidine kinase n=1 Tax=Rheinheimera salexigens TaxID=1628148 RepID=A0A1E7Q506_9GAMM|nr:two-component sensor histidine kinase BarA [Rheinheimera salexigens]OEY69128.1 histidine kinase [Rheinheimera salexigens]